MHNKRPARLPLYEHFVNTPAEITAGVVELGGKYRAMANGYALGSGNSIPEYVPVENYLAMIEGCRHIRDKAGK